MKRTGRSMLAAAGMALACVALAAEPPAAGGHGGHPATSTAPLSLEQTTCPVMVGNNIDPSISSVYKGKRVYFCCPSCKAAFEAAPEKYLDRLPQFAEPERGPDHTRGLGWASLIEPLGITTLALLLLTAAAGLLRRKSPKRLLKCHKALALATVVAALCHATLVFLVH